MEEEMSFHPILENNEEVATLKRDAPPAHYTFKIESYSLLCQFLSKIGSDKYYSREFEVGGYKWKLSLYPKGDKKRKGSDHISLYLVLSETNNLTLGSEVNASFRLFAYDHISDKYLTVEDKKPTRFHVLKTECGISRFLPLVTFNDASNGYLVDDCCIFGVEVFVTQCTGKGERVLITKPQETIDHTMENFSKLENKEYESSPVNIAGHMWCLSIYPYGNDSKGNYLSLFLKLNSDLCPEHKVWVEYELRVKNQSGGPYSKSKSPSRPICFDASMDNWGFREFILLSDLKDKSKGHIVDDTIIVEAVFTQVVTVEDFS